MDWILNPKTNTEECNFNGYGYSIIKILAPSKTRLYDIKGYALYFWNEWRKQPGAVLGEYITNEGNRGYVSNKPAKELYGNLVFDTADEAKVAAAIHHAKDDEPTDLSEDEDASVEEDLIYFGDWQLVDDAYWSQQEIGKPANEIRISTTTFEPTFMGDLEFMNEWWTEWRQVNIVEPNVESTKAAIQEFLSL